MRIVVFSDTFYPQINGVVTSLTNSSRYLANHGHKIMIFVPKSKGNIELGKNISVVPIKSLGLPTYED